MIRCSAGPSKVGTWNSRDRTPVGYLGVNDIALSPDGRYLYAGTDGGPGGPTGSGLLVRIRVQPDSRGPWQGPRVSDGLSITRNAHFERRLIAERTKDGIAAARARGKRLGRQPLDPEKIAAVLSLVSEVEWEAAEPERDTQRFIMQLEAIAERLVAAGPAMSRGSRT